MGVALSEAWVDIIGWNVKFVYEVDVKFVLEGDAGSDWVIGMGWTTGTYPMVGVDGCNLVEIGAIIIDGFAPIELLVAPDY